MMKPMTKDMKKCFDNMSDPEKITMFYTLAEYLNKSVDENDFAEMDEDLQEVYFDIANLVNDINAL